MLVETAFAISDEPRAPLSSIVRLSREEIRSLPCKFAMLLVLSLRSSSSALPTSTTTPLTTSPSCVPWGTDMMFVFQEVCEPVTRLPSYCMNMTPVYMEFCMVPRHPLSWCSSMRYVMSSPLIMPNSTATWSSPWTTFEYLRKGAAFIGRLHRTGNGVGQAPPPLKSILQWIATWCNSRKNKCLFLVAILHQ